MKLCEIAQNDRTNWNHGIRRMMEVMERQNKWSDGMNRMME